MHAKIFKQLKNHQLTQLILFLEQESKLKYTHAGTERTCKLLTERTEL